MILYTLSEETGSKYDCSVKSAGAGAGFIIQRARVREVDGAPLPFKFCLLDHFWTTWINQAGRLSCGHGEYKVFITSDKCRVIIVSLNLPPLLKSVIILG